MKSAYGMAAILLLVAVCLGVAGCFGSGGGSTVSTIPTGATGTLPGGVVATSTTTTATTPTSDDQLSTFRSKDPFIPQAQPVTTTAETPTTLPGGGTSPPTGPGSPSTGSTVTTIFKPVSPGGGGTVTTIPSGGGGGSSTTATVPGSTTSTTAPHTHTMKILAITQVGGAPAVTFQVDGSVYRDRRTGEVVSTSWGQIKVLDINTASRVVTLVQGSETLVLSVGQLIYQ